MNFEFQDRKGKECFQVKDTVIHLCTCVIACDKLNDAPLTGGDQAGARNLKTMEVEHGLFSNFSFESC